MKKNINKDWTLSVHGYGSFECEVPSSLYSVLLENSIINDPFFGKNEYKAFELSEHDCFFCRKVIIAPEEMEYQKIVLRFECIDTVAEVLINGSFCFFCENMHIEYSFDIKKYLKIGENEIVVHVKSPLSYIKKHQEKYKLWGVATTVDGFPHIRKPHYMFGWDWGPQLPDMGIYKNVWLVFSEAAEISDYEIHQKHSGGNVQLEISVANSRFVGASNNFLETEIIIYAPSGQNIYSERKSTRGQNEKFAHSISNPELWWPNGYGEQPLYMVCIILRQNDTEIDRRELRVGLRIIEVSQEKDKWGNEFCFKVNGIKIFAMGADYIPEDNIIPKISKQRTKKLLEAARKANFNCIRVWGGGQYATDEFMDICDEYGLIVWQDFMFACSTYILNSRTEKLLREEFYYNIKRLRSHASLGLFCGNNEMEVAWLNWGIPQDYRLKKDYTEIFERILPEITGELCPEIFYWPASPSSGGGFCDPNNENMGDVHYWDVWIGRAPFESYDSHYFRFCSEFGFQSFPSMETIKKFTNPEDRNPLSDVCESHQKFPGKNECILTYLAQYYKYPFSFETFIYVSQMLQADAIESGVVHMRRNRGRCMGAVYWQLNDCWPAISWSSVDYYGNYKALQYRSHYFFSQTLLSVKAVDNKAVVNISHEGMSDFHGRVSVSVCNNRFEEKYAYNDEISVNALSARDICIIDISDFEKEKNNYYISFKLYGNDGELINKGSCLMVKPKSYNFLKPDIKLTRKDNIIHAEADCFCKGIYLECNGTFFEKNYFDITDGLGVDIPFTGPKDLRAEDISVICVNDL